MDFEAVLAKTRNGVLVLRPSRVRRILLLFAAVVFVALGVGILLHEEGSVILGATTIAFFGLAVVVFAIQLIPGRAYLRLDSSGFTVRSVGRSTFVSWDDVWVFRIADGGPRVVGWIYVAEAAPSGAVADLSRSLTGVEAVLPDNYGMPVEDLALLLESWSALCTKSPSAAYDEGQPESDQPQY